MKKIIIIIFCLIFTKIYSQNITEKKVLSKVNEVTVFIKGAQITRNKTLDLKQGKTLLKFINLSPFIDSKSVQVKATGNVTVLSVNHQQNYLDKLDKQQELIDLETKLKDIKSKITLEQTYISIINDELTFLRENRKIGGRNQELSVTNLKDAENFYSTKLTSLKLKKIERDKNLDKLNKQRVDFELQIKTLTSKREFPNGEILVKVDAKKNTTVAFELSYIVENAGWFPSYDIRAKNVNEPIELVYKANVKQDTKINWSNVKLNLSSADPNVSGIAPELKTYLLNYNTLPPTYNLVSNEITGKVLDENNEPLPGANIMVKGTTIGTTSDFDGNYSITIPNNSSKIEFSYVGFLTQTLPVTNSTLNVFLKQSSQTLDEVVITSYGERKRKNIRKALEGKAAGVSIRGASSLQIPINQIEKQTTINFEIKTPYSIKSDNKSYSVDMTNYSLPADYRYICVPKIDKDAFLIANISDWEKYNLLEGEANIFFENTFVGKSLMNVKYATDTLQISLGRDKKVIVKREKMKNFTSKQFIGSKKEESRVWSVNVKNNKSQKINMLLFDQVPVSTLEEIKVDILNISGAKINSKTGEIKWEFSLAPNESKKFELSYSVKYPKNKSLIIE
ncbi:MAG: mucoidy inhibitor MuiA family protein [Lutibacter sp.]|uniref:DUF4139 domain-containing protein n=1 Tax=Lutibacter sp. TaxID=1925666 RepID=UPI00299D070B|nr:mucoidy inhibitor MuiA family protein [Lutibacter sp.]MDX1830469.1 mucoidy inhibitor MuiA family protein [Lutibacter sp.]